MSGISSEEADLLAVALNQVCAATLQALKTTDMQQRKNVLISVRDFREQFEKQSEVSRFLKVLERWLGGKRPTNTDVKGLADPFGHALATMLQDVPAPVTTQTTSHSQSSHSVPPISRRVLTQLISAVVMTAKSDNVGVQRKLAAQLINIQSELEGEWRERMGALFENLRYVLGGADPYFLPPVPDAEYQTLWQNTIQVLQNTQIKQNQAVAHQQLLDRLVHNTRFTLRSGKPELISGFLRVLEDLQYQAHSTDSPAIVTLVAAIRAHLQGLDATPFTMLLEGQELTAWQKIIEVSL